MNLDQLRAVQATEREKDSLQSLRPSFYRDVGAYIADLERERESLAAEAEDPFSDPAVSQLTDEIETAREVVRALYERRVGKIVKQASLAATGLTADDEGLTAEEQELFETLVTAIEGNMEEVLGAVDGAAPDDGTADPSDREDGEAADPPPDRDPEATADAEAAPAGDVDRVTVHVTDDVGSFVGVDDREYSLVADDVVTLPTENATPLVDRDLVEILDRPGDGT